jgi:hypothetical protein
VERLRDDAGILEHAEGAVPRREHGYCTDDVSRQLLVACLYPEAIGAREIAEQGLAFVRHAAMPDGRFRSRMNYARLWMDDGESDDASGRALWSLGVAAQRAPWPHVRDGALGLFETMSVFTSHHWHSNAFAALGAAAVLESAPTNRPGIALAERLARQLPRPRPSSGGSSAGRPDGWSGGWSDGWRWPEARMSYSSAALADALLALTPVDPSLGDEGLTLLHWLADRVSGNGFSPVPVDGLGPSDLRPGFDQQPIEAQAFAGACWRAWTLTNDPQWLKHVVLAAAWFVGANDAHTYMIDRRTNGCYDGLMSYGRNENQGAESTLAMLHTMAILRRGVEEGAIDLHYEDQVVPFGFPNGYVDAIGHLVADGSYADHRSGREIHRDVRQDVGRSTRGDVQMHAPHPTLTIVETPTSVKPTLHKPTSDKPTDETQAAENV